MILLYTLGLLVLGVSTFITQRRARALERKYIRAAQQADQLAKELSYKGGNSNQADLFVTARRQYELGRLVQLRDRLEGKYDRWEAFTEYFRRLRKGLLLWKGRFVPYLLGVLDVAVIVTALLLSGTVDPTKLRETVESVRAVVKK